MKSLALLLPMLLIAALAGAFGCASALKPLDTDSELARTDGDDPVAAARLSDQAAALYAQRPDHEAVERAAELWRRAAIASPARADGIIGAVRALVWLADHMGGDERRQEIATRAVQTAQWCSRREPERASCHYWLAVAIGVQADARRSTAMDGLRAIVRELRIAVDEAPEIEHAGPHRVLALVLLRAPGWPTGPGDADAGLEHARQALELAPEYPPNLLALAEAQREVDAIDASRATYERARELAHDWRQRGDPDAPEWLAEAESALTELLEPAPAA